MAGAVRTPAASAKGAGVVSSMARVTAFVVASLGLASLGGCVAAPPPVVESVLVVADEMSQPTDAPSWTDRVVELSGTTVNVDAIAGSGWLTASPQSVADRIAGQQADVVVLALGATDVLLAVDDQIREIVVRDGVAAATATGGRVFVLPPLVPAGTGQSAAWSQVIATVCSELGAIYLPVDLASEMSSQAMQELVASTVVGAIAAGSP
jgi:hypothetical protein